uniref:DNA polymerase n=1 Tax=Clavaria fumosa TaxID=264083 RepID=A0A7T3PCV8_9AGAR|nr:DNA polymerase [Clavaria fumosa]QPZ51165.1 DNA polymerase [Clavaria fumosa]
MNSTGSERWISKQLLNCLYGVFGRKQSFIETINVHNSDIHKYVATNIIKTIIPINNEISTLLLVKNIDSNLISELNNTCEIEIKTSHNNIKSNVAIARAITAYARIHMINLKFLLNSLGINIYYSDTDSLFTDKPIPQHLIGKDLGLLKEELNGLIINKSLFLGIKQYGYLYFDNNNNKIEKSVFAGVKRDSLSLSEIIDLFNGKSIIKIINTRFYIYLNNLSIKIKPMKLTIIKNLIKY